MQLQFKGQILVTDTSDDPSTAAANDETIVTIDPIPYRVTKTASVTDEGMDSGSR